MNKIIKEILNEKRNETSMEFLRQSFADPNKNFRAKVQFVSINDFKIIQLLIMYVS